jgi:putative FmdB family regulatory protein
MIEYEYECDNCSHSFSIRQSIKDDALSICPECNESTLYRVFHAPYVSVKGDVKTIGQLADKNTKNMGRYELEEKKANDINVNKEQREKRDLNRKINKMTPDQKTKWILGDK